MRLGIVTIVGCSFVMAGTCLADDPAQELAEIRAGLADVTLKPDERSRRALDAAANLDRAALRATTLGARRARWAEAVAILDETLAKAPEVGSAGSMRFQAGVYAWAIGRSFADQVELAPGDASARSGAVRGLDEAVARLRPVMGGIATGDSGEAFAQNVRFRLAQAIADRARFEPENDPKRLASEREAWAMLDGSIVAPRLRGFARLLRAELANRLGLHGEARIEVEEAEKSDPPPPVGPILEAKVASLLGRERFDEARKLIAAAPIDSAWKGWLDLRTLLARRRTMPPGSGRDEADGEAFRVAMGLRGSPRPEARRALMELARGIDEPPKSAPPEWWGVLADGHLRLGDAARAGRLAAKGADRAGTADSAAALRFRAGAALFEAGKFAEADAQLTLLAESARAPKDLRARAGMLRALARGRAVVDRQDGASREGYLAALEAQVRDYPDDPATGEARWLLGKLRLAGDRRDEAVALWAKLPHGHPRWLEARLSSADLLREAVEESRINRDQAAARSRMAEARRSLKEAIASAAEGSEAVELGLALARLELVPEAGEPSSALDACDRVLKGGARADQHRQARLLRMAALALLNRFVEAEPIARAEARIPDDPDALRIAARPIDRAAAEVESETSRRRLGLILRILATRLVDRLEDLPEAARDEARLRLARALLFAGEPDAARASIARWGGPTGPGAEDPALLRDLADLYLRLEAFKLAADVEKLRSTRLKPGSPPWFEARYGLALSLFRSGKAKEARQVVDATSILHPDLGGGDLREKFERLRRKVGEE